MQFDSWQAFWNMGGYALYVWLSFGLTLLVMVALTISRIVTRKKLLVAVVEEQARMARIKQARRRAEDQQSDPESVPHSQLSSSETS